MEDMPGMTLGQGISLQGNEDEGKVGTNQHFYYKNYYL
jgi:hypothetical protein